MSLSLTLASERACFTGATHRPTRLGGKLVEPGAGYLQFEVLRPRGVRCDERQADGCLHHAGELDFGLFRRFGETLQGLAVLSQIDSVVAEEVIRHIVHQHFVEVVAAQVRVAGGGADLEDAVADIENGDVEGSAAEVEDQDGFVLLLVETVRERGGGRFVDDAQHVESGDLTGVFGGLPLGIVEVRGDGDHSICDLLAQVLGGVIHQAAQYLAPKPLRASTACP